MDIEKLKSENLKRWEIMKIKPEFLTSATKISDRIIAHRSVYERVQLRTNIPWFFIACLHNMESSGNFSTWLANGDPLSGPTVQVPKGLGKGLAFPISWEDAAVLSLQHERWKGMKNDIQSLLILAEMFNGIGYYHRNIPSPYVWSGSDQYTKGKFVSDGKFDANAVSKQLGIACILKVLESRGIIAPQIVTIKGGVIDVIAIAEDGNTWRGSDVAGLEDFLKKYENAKLQFKE